VDTEHILPSLNTDNTALRTSLERALYTLSVRTRGSDVERLINLVLMAVTYLSVAPWSVITSEWNRRLDQTVITELKSFLNDFRAIASACANLAPRLTDLEQILGANLLNALLVAQPVRKMDAEELSASKSAIQTLSALVPLSRKQKKAVSLAEGIVKAACLYRFEQSMPTPFYSWGDSEAVEEDGVDRTKQYPAPASDIALLIVTIADATGCEATNGKLRYELIRYGKFLKAQARNPALSDIFALGVSSVNGHLI